MPLRALVYYKPSQHISKPAFEARTVPEIFAGESHKKVHVVLDYESLRTKTKGFGRQLQVHADELVTVELCAFPFFNAANASLEGGRGELPKIALPFEEGPPAPEVRKLWTEPFALRSCIRDAICGRNCAL